MIAHILSSHRSGNDCEVCVIERWPAGSGAKGGTTSMTISSRVRFLVLACGLAAGQVVFGQTFGSIDGEARDVTGAAVAGVTVSATNKGTNAARSVITNDAGAYSFPSLAPGTYSLRAEKPGFKTVLRNEIELQDQQSARIDIELQVGQVSES